VKIELLAGALMALVARGPWVNPSWRHSFLGRLSIEVIPSVVYETALDVNRGKPWHCGKCDVFGRLSGSLGVEIILR
jgi:hypothetical protein